MQPNRRVLLLFVAGYVGMTFSWGLVRLWAARHSTHDGPDGVVARAVNVGA